MTEQNYLDFILALGQEYCQIIESLCEYGADPHDGYEVFAMAYGPNDISAEKLYTAINSDTELTRIRDIARKWQESDQITEEHLREILRRTLLRWPLEESRAT